MKLYIQTYLDIIHINIDKEYIYIYMSIISLDPMQLPWPAG